MSTATDIRLPINFYQRAKTARLISACGNIGIIDLQKLWMYTAEHFPKGVLDGLTDAEIILLAGITTSNFIDILQDLKFVRRNGKRWVEIDNWEIDQSWVVGAPERSEKARKAAKAKWDQKS